MTEELVKFIDTIRQFDWKTIGSLAILGFVLIVVNSITHYAQQRISERRAGKKKSREAFEDNIVPLMKNTDNLIARLSNLTCGFVDENEFRTTLSLLANEKEYEHRLETFSLQIPTWPEITALYFLQYAWSSQHFRYGVSQVVNNELIDDVEYFIRDKIPMVLRGKLYGKRFLNRELYDEAVAFFPARDFSSIEEPTIVDLFGILKDDSWNRKVFRRLVEFFTTHFHVPNELQLDHSQTDFDKYCVFCQLSIYLIDLYQNACWSSKWEEYRVFYARTLQEWNIRKTDIIYLYYPNDLKSENYLNTFPEDILIRYFWGRIFMQFQSWSHVQLQPFTPIHFYFKKISLWMRARKFLHRHHKKRIRRSGVTIHAGSQHDLFISFALPTLFNSLKNYLEATKRRKSVS